MRSTRYVAILLFAWAGAAGLDAASETLPPVGELARALELRKASHYEEANALFVTWLEAHPRDAEAHFDYGYSLSLEATATGNPELATRLRKQAYAEGKKAKELGSTNVVLDLLLQSTDENGADLADPKHFSGNPQAAALVKQGEQAFSAHRMDEALQFYQDALRADPRCYSAALFSGDVYFSQPDYGKAIEWFSKAVGIDPNRETAWRYWGDALLHRRQATQALDKYLEALVAEPYNRLPREMLDKFAKAMNTTVQHPGIALPRLEVTIKDGKTNLSVAPDTSPLVLAYGMARAAWLNEQRDKFFPKDAPVRHSLPEEVDGLRKFAAIAVEMKEKSPGQVAPLADTVATIKQLDASGLLEAYVLLDRADAGIAQDYIAYRQEHRDRLLKYGRVIWFGPPKPAAAANPDGAK